LIYITYFRRSNFREFQNSRNLWHKLSRIKVYFWGLGKAGTYTFANQKQTEIFNAEIFKKKKVDHKNPPKNTQNKWILQLCLALLYQDPKTKTAATIGETKEVADVIQD